MSRPAAGRSNTPIAYYPDVDDTAVVVTAMDRFARETGEAPYGERIARARAWVEGLQSKNGGWGAFDADNCHYHLNHIPFADHGALLDPPTADVSARCVSMLAQLGDTPESSERLARGVDYLLAEQMAGRQLVRALGRELHLRRLVVAVRAERRRPAAGA